MKTPMERIVDIQQMTQEDEVSWDAHIVTYALCEIARQLDRLATLYEFELGLEKETETDEEGTDGMVAGE